MGGLGISIKEKTAFANALIRFGQKQVKNVLYLTKNILFAYILKSIHSGWVHTHELFSLLCS